MITVIKKKVKYKSRTIFHSDGYMQRRHLQWHMTI